MIRLRQSSIRDKLALALVGTALITFIVACAAFLFVGFFTLESRARQVMEPYAQLVSVGVEAAVEFEDPRRAQEVLATLRANPQILAAELVLRDGRILARYGGIDTIRPPHPGTNGVHLAGNRAELIQNLSEGASLRLVMSLAEFNRQTRNTLLLLAAGGSLLLAATSLGLRAVLQRTIVGPIAALAETVEQVRTLANYHRRVPVSGADELARLGRGFNDMMGVIQERENDLRQLTLFQRTLLDNVAYGIISATLDGTVTSFNPAAERLLGYAANEVVGKQTPKLWHDPEELARRAGRLSEETGSAVAPGFDVFTARPRQNLSEENEWTFIRRDGTRVPVRLSVTALRDESGQITGFVGLTYDLTERKRAEDEIRLLNQKLEQRVAERTAELAAANKELESFSYTVSHDLRAPLRAINGFSHALLEDCSDKLDETAVSYLGRIDNACNQMSQLIKDILDLAQVSRHEIRHEAVDISALADAVAQDVRQAAPDQAMEFVIAPDLVATGDARLLQIALTNLIGNACKYSSTRPVTRVEIGQAMHQDERAFFVRDNGVGFDMAKAHKLFGAFQRLHSTTEFPGTGIGLATVQRIVHRHGGRVWAESQPDQGAVFHFTLPQASDDAEATKGAHQ